QGVQGHRPSRRTTRHRGLGGAHATSAGSAWLHALGHAAGLHRRQLRGRLILRPAFSRSGTTFSSLMPLRYQGGVWWVRARLSTVIDTPGLSLATVADQIASGGIDFDIEQAAGTGDFLPPARLTLRHVNPPCDDIAFDPTLHSDPEVELAPGWLGDVRRAAYRRSREGRYANNGQRSRLRI